LKFVASNFERKIPAKGELTPEDLKLIEAVNELTTMYINFLDKMKIHDPGN